MSLSPNKKRPTNIFKCDRRAANISEKLLRFYNEKEFLDTDLIVGFGNDCFKIQAHSIVLCALSEYFLETICSIRNKSKANKVKEFKTSSEVSISTLKLIIDFLYVQCWLTLSMFILKIFSSATAPANNIAIQLKEIDSSTLKSIIDFMYTGWIELSIENVEHILRAAVFLKIKILIDGCCDFIETHITSSNCLVWLRLAKELSLSQLSENSLNCAYEHFEKVSKEKELLLLNEKELKDLLSKDNLLVGFEKHVFMSIIAWIEYDKVNRNHLTLELLSMVRYKFLKPRFIIENRNSICKTLDSCELICNWLEWHLQPENRHKLVVISHLNSQNIAIQSPGVNVWSVEKRKLHFKLKSGCSRIVIDEKLIVVGGLGNGFESTNIVECLDLLTLQWSHLPPMKEARIVSQLANLNGNLCVFGGRNINNSFEKSLEIYNFVTRKWNFVPMPSPSPSPPSSPSKPSQFTEIIAHKGIVYIVDFENGCLQSYNVSTNQWATKAFEQEKLIYFGCAAVDRYLYVIGGYNYSRDTRVDTVKRYDFANDKWCEMAPMATNRSSINAVVYGNKIVICGGNPDPKLVEMYNTDKDSWQCLSPLAINISFYFSVLCTLPVKV